MNSHLKLTIILYLLLVSIPCLAQKVENPQDYAFYDGMLVSKIIILGNENTKDVVIHREMKTKVGEPFDPDLVRQDRKRIQNLLLFTRVEIYPAKDQDNSVGLIVVVAERWHFFPYPLLFRNERSWALDKWSYGAGLIHNNVRGLNHKLLTEFWLGYNPGGIASYTNPWFGGDKQLYYKARLYSMTLKSKTLQAPTRFNEFHRGASFTFGKRWGYHTYTTMALGYDYIQFPDEYRFLMPSERDRQHQPSIGLGFQYDTRDLYEYPKDGWWLSVAATNLTAFPGQLNYTLLSADARRYMPLYRELSLALRLNVDLSYGEVPVFSHYYLGYSERIRGQFFDAMEGDSRGVFMAELRFPILPIQYMNVESGAPMFGQYSQDLPFGVSGGIFYDVGTAWFKNENNIPSDFFSGVGIGLHLHLPYVDVFRIEYAFNPEWQGQFIFDTKVAF
jgi:outer membrane protein assembly factor BamA